MSLTAARPYTKAVFATALEEDQLNSWLATLMLLSQIIKNQAIAQLISNPNLSNQFWIELIEDILKSASTDKTLPIKPSLHHFLQLIIERRRLNILPAVAKLYQEQLTAYEGLTKVEVSSAHALGEKQRESLQTALEKRLKTKVSIQYKEDPSLIAGVLIRAGQWVIDGSVKDKLNRLRVALDKA